MKYLMIALMFVSQVCFAEQPAYLKDATITVTLKNGKTYTYSANEYMVVKRGAKSAAPVQVAPLAEKSVPSQSSESSEGVYRLTLHGGMGFDGQNVDQSANQVEVTQKRAFVYGASLSRKVSEKVSVGGTVLSNKTYLLGIGYDFK